MRSIKVRVPASAANLGPGFDCLAMALGVYLTLTLSLEGEGLAIEMEGEGADSLPRSEDNLLVRSVRQLLAAEGHRATGLRIHVRSEIPVGSGLGSSAAAVTAGLVAANACLGRELSIPTVLQHAVALEGHADNAAASLVGGLALAVPDGEGWSAHRLPVAALKLAVVTPELALPTTAMRELLPPEVPLSDASFNLAHVALAVEAFRLGDYGLLSEALQDRLHEPRRSAHIPGWDSVRRAAREAGAAAVVLAGAGPSLIAFAASGHSEIAHAMQAAFGAAGVRSRGNVFATAEKGATIESSGQW